MMSSNNRNNPPDVNSASFNASECLRKGSLGAIGAIPGTLLSHPFDVIKIRLQTLHSPSLFSAFRHGRLYNGLTHGVKQKFLTRGPMFLFAEFGSQTYSSTGIFTPTQSVFLGSVTSGYLTGALSSIHEWCKVLRATPSLSQNPSNLPHTPFTLIKTTLSCHPLSLVHRMNAAGTRNSIFDGTFFTLTHSLTQNSSMGVGPSYALSASLAVVVDYAFDVATKRTMSRPPGVPVENVLKEVKKAWRKNGFKVYRGVAPKTVEFAVSYMATGLVAGAFASLGL